MKKPDSAGHPLMGFSAILSRVKHMIPPTEWIPPITFMNISTYYTYFSFLLFLCSFSLDCDSTLKISILMNSIAVGILGNLIVVYSGYEYIRHSKTTLMRTKKEKEKKSDEVYSTEKVLINNFVVHTLPMIISFFVLLKCRSLSYRDSLSIYILAFIFMLIWSIIPSEAGVGGNKIINSYPGWSVKSLLASSMIILIISLAYTFCQKN